MNLHIQILSFGYHRSGIPADPSGHGGGFVFDCRALPNPGREARYAAQSGMDEEVRSYLEQFPEVWGFLKHVFVLIDGVVGLYQENGFENLQVCFGCTGGQHRSVFCAMELAQHLRSNGFAVDVLHTEQGVWW